MPHAPSYEQVLSATSKKLKVKAAIDLLSGLYPAAQASNAEVFMTAIAMLLMEYPDWLIDEFAHPTRGIVASCKFFPNIAESKDWLEQHVREQAQPRQLTTQEQLRALPPPVDRTDRPTLAALREKYGDTYGLSGRILKRM